MKTYRVKEIFGPTLQGEGPYSGVCVYFVRLSNCNRWNGRAGSKPNSVCYYCDTDFVGGELMTSEDILGKLSELHTSDFRPNVVVSGGEPMLQLDRELARALDLNFGDVHVETNGSLPIPPEVDEWLTHVTVSPKQNADETEVQHPGALKFLYPWVGPDITPEHFKAQSSAVYIQPIEGPAYDENLAGAIQVCLSNPDYRLSLQTHKILNLR